ncbi:MAG TPA: recombination protein O N-terminal domain-containing protein [Phycisphaerales bacterium]|nr:recombination protein O N-terminal domain-containing protein [Phycisphaerales bacterium]
MSLHTDDAICVRAWDWSETSQTVVFFARALGVVRCVAKGSKREDARFSGGIEPMTRGELIVSLRKLERNPQSLATLTSWDLQEPFPAVRSGLSAFYAGHAMLDVVQHAVTDADPHPALYDALLAGARMLCGDAAVNDRAVLLVAWSALSDTGHAPELFRDVRTGDELSAARTYAFAPRLGGLTADAAGVGSVGGAAVSPVWRVRAETVAVLRDVSRGGVSPGIDPVSIVRAASLLLMYYREVFSCDPSAVRAWMERVQARDAGGVSPLRPGAGDPR